MLRFVYFLLVATLFGVYADTGSIFPVPFPDGRIVGGRDADIRQFPHQISMRYNGRHRCGGSIYSQTIVITASHCVDGTVASSMTIVAGSTFLSQKNIEVQVLSYIMHEKYRALNTDYDVAILVLGSPLPYNEFIQPIALAKVRPPAGTEITVTGWGALTEGGGSPDQLQQVNVNLVDNSECRKAYSILLTSRMLCGAVDGGGKDACQGDSGGPLIVGNELLGIVSWGSGCARAGYPGVYASVPDLYDWTVETAAKNAIEFA